MRLQKPIFSLILLLFFFINNVSAKQTIYVKHQNGDATPYLRELFKDIKEKDIKLIFEKGNYFFSPDYAFSKYCAITNHGNGIKNIVFPFINYNSVEIEGNGSNFTFHGLEMPFLFENCKKIDIKGFTIDWDIPFLFEGEVIAVNKKEGWRDIKPFTEGFSWTIKNGRLLFPNIDGFNYSSLGSTLPFDKEEKRVVHNAKDCSSNPTLVEKLPNGLLRFHEKMKNMPPVGSILNSKGNRELDRYAPAFEIKDSKNVSLENITVHHALGMAYLFERTEDIAIKGCKVILPEGKDRCVSSTADASHFANCKGHILIENCTFKNMLDDGTNVHGTYVVVDKILSNNSVRVKLMHFEQTGFEFAGKGDEVWFIHAPNPSRAEINKVSNVNIVNEIYSDITFEKALSKDLKEGDILENKTWNPTFTMRGCTIMNNRARNVIIKSPLKTVIENNHFSSMMSSILLRGETYFWFESGAVEDVLIKNNRFDYCAYSGDHAILYVTPRLGKDFDTTIQYDRNIRFENNIINNCNHGVVWADRIDGLVIKNNTITQTFEKKAVNENAYLFDFVNSKNINITGNKYIGKHTKWIKADETSLKTLKENNNKGFKL